MNGFWVVQSESRNNPEAAKKYSELWKPIGQKFDARILAGPDSHDCREGNNLQRLFIVSFPTYDQAVACYESAEYQEAKKFGQLAYTRSFFILQCIN